MLILDDMTSTFKITSQTIMENYGLDSLECIFGSLEVP